MAAAGRRGGPVAFARQRIPAPRWMSPATAATPARWSSPASANAPAACTPLPPAELAELAKADPSVLVVNDDDMARALASALA